MDISPQTRQWMRHIFHRSVRTRTTWKFRFGLVALLLLMAWSTRGWWSVAIAESVICDANAAPSDAILVENFDVDYLTFETAARLRKAGVARRVLVPVAADGDPLQPKGVQLGVTELLADLAHLGSIEVVPIREVEPISLNAAGDILRFIEQAQIRSVVVVSPLFRSRRSEMVYAATLGSAGITVRCEPVQHLQNPHTWTSSLHGIQNVAEQWAKLQYYRLYVLPFKARL